RCLRAATTSVKCILPLSHLSTNLQQFLDETLLDAWLPMSHPALRSRPGGAGFKFASLAFALDRKQVDLKDEGGVGPNVGARAALAIGKLGGNKELPLRSYGHELQTAEQRNDAFLGFVGGQKCFTFRLVGGAHLLRLLRLLLAHVFL